MKNNLLKNSFCTGRPDSAFGPGGILIIISLIMVFLHSCKKFVSISAPPTELLTNNIFDNEATATSAITGIYSRMMESSGFSSGGISSITMLTGLSSDELENFSTDPEQAEFYANALRAPNTLLMNNLWNEPFQYIYTANSILESLPASNGVSADVKNQLLGEAEFIRAFCDFYLVNLFGDIPLVLSSDYRLNASLRRTSAALVYQQIIKDLLDAQNKLSDGFTFSKGERVRPNKGAATALLARVYLYTGDWTNAVKTSSLLIGQTTYYRLATSLDSVFLANSPEAIWQLKPVAPGYNTNEANDFILQGAPQMVALSSQVVDAFEANDERRRKWIDSIVIGAQPYYYAFKYKVSYQVGSSDLVEYSMVFRLAEQYLIRAEAELQLDNLTDAAADLNSIRSRAGLPNTSASDQADLLAAILHERQVELFTELGHRWMDLKRIGAIDDVMETVTTVKGGIWNPTDQLYPIPQTEILNDPFLKQNEGY